MIKKYPSPVFPRRDGPHRNAATPPAKPSRHRHLNRRTTTTAEDDDENETFGDPIKCTGKSCESCTAGVIADCVAVCCCPCAVVNILVFAFLKVPWMVGRRILKMGKKHKGGRNHSHLEKAGKCCALEWECGIGAVSGISRNGAALSESESEFFGFGEEELEGNSSASFDADQELWFELHQVGHLGFGRVSFTGIPIPCS